MTIYHNFFKIAVFLALLSTQTLAKNQKNSYLNKNFTVNIRKHQDHLVSKFQDWSFYKVPQKNRTICYILSSPIEQNGNHFKRARSYFIVNNLINDADEITVISGYRFKENSDVEISFGHKKLYLFPFKSHAWAFDKNDDLNIIKEMQLNPEFSVTGFDKRGKITTDRYSLIGFRHAYFKMKKICK